MKSGCALSESHVQPDTAEVWARATGSIRKHLANRKGQVLVERIDEDGAIYLEELVAPEAKFEVVSATRDVDPTTLATSPNGVWKKAEALGWKINASRSVTRHEPVFILKDGKPRKDGTQARQGDVRTPTHDETHLVITAVDALRTTGFAGSWDDGKPTGFRIVDPVGIPIENYVDYWRRKESIKPKDDYNDGTDRIVHRHFFDKITPFNDWLTDWLEILAPESAPKRKAPKTKPTVDETIAAPMLIGEWNG
jgi:hypothetical protein